MLQASTTLLNPPSPAEADPVAVTQAVPLLQLEQNIQALRTVVQVQQTQLRNLQALQQAQPLVGLTTDQPWGLALEGLSVGLLAVVLGAGLVLVLRRSAGPSAPASGRAAPAEFQDSMLYLADQEGGQDSLPPVETHLHDPQHDSKASTLAHEDGDPALEYHRMALTAQGLSVIAGAGKIDSDRMPLDVSALSSIGDQKAHSIFSPSLPTAEFDQRAAEEEVERVRRYLAQRRADRAQTAVAWEHDAIPLLPPDGGRVADAADPGARPLEQVDIHLDMGETIPDALEPLAHAALSDGASLLVALSEEDGTPVDLGVPSLAAPEGDDEPLLPSADVQLALALEFRDLGLWDEARARVQEVLDQPDVGQHAIAQAHALMDALQQMAPRPQHDTPQDEASKL